MAPKHWSPSCSITFACQCILPLFYTLLSNLPMHYAQAQTGSGTGGHPTHPGQPPTPSDMNHRTPISAALLEEPFQQDDKGIQMLNK